MLDRPTKTFSVNQSQSGALKAISRTSFTADIDSSTPNPLDFKRYAANASPVRSLPDLQCTTTLP